MLNPFESLGDGESVEPVTYDEIGGVFSCDERGCWEKASEAKYYVSEQLLTWECPKGHVSVIKGFVF